MQLTSMLDPAMTSDSKGTVPLGSRYIRFGPFQLDQSRQEVSRGAEQLKLQGKVYQVLLALLEKQGEAVTREELRARLWPAHTHVNYDANVNTAVNKLRQLLGDSTDKPQYIATIPRKGYCLIVATEFAVAPVAVRPFPQSTMEPTSPRGTLTATKASFWTTAGVIALILAGMLVGAALTRIWIAHLAANGGPHSG
jgi:DNA-binding winged helix-turn-helix (wHTH) protein